MVLVDLKNKYHTANQFRGNTIIIPFDRYARFIFTLSLPESNLESINVVVPLQCVNETLVYVCDHSNESYRAVLSSGAVCL